MSGHADTIREGLDFYARNPQPTPRTVGGPPHGLRYDRALAALDALVAENQQLRDALERIVVVMGEGEAGYTADAFEIARAALAGTPSEDTE